MAQRRDQYLRFFCRKLLGYALGRGVQLSDQPLVDEMLAQLAQHDYRIFGRGRNDRAQFPVPQSSRGGGGRHYRGNQRHRRRAVIINVVILNINDSVRLSIAIPI